MCSAVQELVTRANREDLMLFYNLPAFADKDANAFLAGVARTHDLIKKVRAPLIHMLRDVPMLLLL